MGIDFIDKTKAGFRRRESQELRKLGEEGLFASQTPSRRTFRGHASIELTGLTPGTVCFLHQTDDYPTIYDRNNRIIATASRLPEDLMRLLTGPTHGSMLVTIDAVLDLTDEIEFSIDNRS